MNVASLVKSNPKIPTLAPGDTVRVSTRVIEGDKERIQAFQGVVIGIRRGGEGSNFTVRRVTYGVGVERTFPFNSPRVEKVEVIKHGKVRRAKLYYLRGLSAKASRIKERRLSPQALEREEALRLEREQQEALLPELEPEAELTQEVTPEPEQEEQPELKQE